MEGQNVVITSKITKSEAVACTAMFCVEDPCCNSCSAGLMAGDIRLVSGSIEIGCSGTECDWEDTCTYSEGDVAVIYGTVGDNGTSIYVNDRCLLGTSSGFNDECGMPRVGYNETTIDSLAGKNGQSVMVTNSIDMNTDLAACTMMFCQDDNLCCNSCYADARFGNVSLVSETNAIGCHGTNCGYEDNCIYESKEIVTVYGKVVADSESVTIEVDDHCYAKPGCTDVGSIDYGLCMMHMGYGVSNGKCAPIGGCGSNEHVFFDDMRDCEAACFSPSCKDHSEEFYGNCKMVIGYGVVDGECASIGGCNRTADLFDSMSACEQACEVGIATTSVITASTPSTCVDFTDEFFGPCKMILGYGLVDGACTTLGGCNRTDDMFQSMEECEAVCGGNSMVTTESYGEKTMGNGGFAIAGYKMTGYLVSSASLVLLSFIFV